MWGKGIIFILLNKLNIILRKVIEIKWAKNQILDRLTNISF